MGEGDSLKLDTTLSRAAADDKQTKRTRVYNIGGVNNINFLISRIFEGLTHSGWHIYRKLCLETYFAEKDLHKCQIQLQKALKLPRFYPHTWQWRPSCNHSNHAPKHDWCDCQSWLWLGVFERKITIMIGQSWSWSCKSNAPQRTQTHP